MNNQFTVIKSFRDKTDGQTYGIGSTYESQDEQRTQELEMGGYIARMDSEASQMAKQEAKGKEFSQKNAQAMAQNQQQIEKNIEPKTVVNGKVVSIKQAQAAEAFHEAKENQTGIQNYHNNDTESVPAGQLAQQQTQAEAQQQNAREQQQTIRQANVQSGQQHLDNAMNETQTGFEASASQMYSQGIMSKEQINEFTQQSNQASNQASNQSFNQQNQSAQAQQQSQQAGQSASARAEMTNPASAEAEEAANNQKAGARARAKKDNQ